MVSIAIQKTLIQMVIFIIALCFPYSNTLKGRYRQLLSKDEKYFAPVHRSKGKNSKNFYHP